MNTYERNVMRVSAIVVGVIVLTAACTDVGQRCAAYTAAYQGQISALNVERKLQEEEYSTTRWKVILGMEQALAQLPIIAGARGCIFNGETTTFYPAQLQTSPAPVIPELSPEEKEIVDDAQS